QSIPGVRKKRVPLANFPAPLRGAKCPNSRTPALAGLKPAATPRNQLVVDSRLLMSAETSWIGREIRTYKILSLLGKGGMGEVYRARDTRLGRDVAIKVLRTSFANDAARRSRFEQEARALAALNHPNIGAIYGLEEA